MAALERSCGNSYGTFFYVIVAALFVFRITYEFETRGYLGIKNSVDNLYGFAYIIGFEKFFSHLFAVIHYVG